MKVIFALGNPKREFINTRHNLGFWFIDELSKDSTIVNYINNNQLILEKNKHYMNEAGLSAKKVVDFSNLPVDNLCVVHDDWDLDLGIFKMQKGRGSARHKGVQSVIDSLGSQDFWRLRIGMGPAPEGDKEEFVLGRISRTEQAQLEAVRLPMVEAVKKWVELDQGSKFKNK